MSVNIKREKKYILSLDQGTTSSRAILFNREGKIEGMAQKEFAQIYPKPGWVEHNPMEIWGTQIGVAKEVLESSFGINPGDIAAIGITNQRETTILWDKNTGKPVSNAIVWQCRRTAAECENIKKDKLFSDYIRKNTGLLPDAYFSATKIAWILDNVEGVREKANKGDIAFGTVDSWLIWNLTRGKIHVTDFSNASRTMLFNILELKWDKEILHKLNIPGIILPEVRSSSEIYGETDPDIFGGISIPVSGAAGDQQAALFGQGCFSEGMVKNTYGTGCFMLMNTGNKPIISKNRLLTTIGWGIDDHITYALEGSVFVAGAVIQWLRDEMKILYDAADSEFLASRAADNGGVYLVPAFTGLGAPYWDMNARGIISGLSRGTNIYHIVRSALESIAFQTKDILEAMKSDSGIEIEMLKVDGGASKNGFLMQFQSDILNVETRRPDTIETTALGAAYFAGLAVGFWESVADLKGIIESDSVFHPSMDDKEREKLYRGWKKAVKRSLSEI